MPKQKVTREEIIELAFFNQSITSYAQIAEITGLKLPSVISRVKSCREGLIKDGIDPGKIRSFGDVPVKRRKLIDIFNELSAGEAS